MFEKNNHDREGEAPVHSIELPVELPVSDPTVPAPDAEQNPNQLHQTFEQQRLQAERLKQQLFCDSCEEKKDLTLEQKSSLHYKTKLFHEEKNNFFDQTEKNLSKMQDCLAEIMNNKKYLSDLDKFFHPVLDKIDHLKKAIKDISIQEDSSDCTDLLDPQVIRTSGDIAKAKAVQEELLQQYQTLSQHMQELQETSMKMLKIWTSIVDSFQEMMPGSMGELDEKMGEFYNSCSEILQTYEERKESLNQRKEELETMENSLK